MKKRPRPRKRTSQRVSKIAGYWLSKAKLHERAYRAKALRVGVKGTLVPSMRVPVDIVKALCGTALSQDEVRAEGRGRK